LPWLAQALAQEAYEDATQPRAAAAEWLVARGRPQQQSCNDWRRWLLDGLDGEGDLLQRFPAGPCVAALHPDQRPAVSWACARPVHLLTAIDHLQLSPATITLPDSELVQLVSDLNVHFADRGYFFEAGLNGRDWLLACAADIRCTSTEPADAAGVNLRNRMPGGRDGPAIRALMNEVQMLLHDHPVNAGRAASALPVVNSLWLWGFGRAARSARVELPELCTDDAWLAGMWTLHGGQARDLADISLATSRLDRDLLVGWSDASQGTPEDSLMQAERGCFTPAVAALRSGVAASIEMLLGERAYVADRRASLKFWRRRRPLGAVLT